MDANEIKRNDTPVTLFNPLPVDFVDTYRDEDNKPIEYTIHSFESQIFPKYMADIFLKKMVEMIINDRKLGFVTPEDRKELEKDILI